MGAFRRVVRWSLGAALAVVWGVASPAAGQAVADPLYVCIQDEARIAVIDMATGALVRTIDLTELGFSANAKPHHIVGEPDGAHWYVSLIGENRVIKLDAGGRVVGQAEMETPGMLALLPGEGVLAVSRSMSAVNPPSSVGVARLPSLDFDELDVIFSRPHPMVATSSGYVYSGSLGESRLAALDLASESVTLTDIPGGPHALVQYAVSPDGRTLVAATELSGQLLVFDLATPERPELLTSVDIGPMAFDPAFTADGTAVWVPVKGANEVAIVETTGWTVVHRIRHDALRQPHAIAFSRDGSRAFVSNNNTPDHMAGGGHAAHGEEGAGIASLVVIDVTSHEVTNAIPLGRNLTGMGVRVP
ncbi:MAG: hypothetical protein OEO23_00635 [Gemmatimonadota bacterium]|nr:hypothetical protein [Gemmatimonadota bacterium]